MPSEPRQHDGPSLEELSAFIDHELSAEDQAIVDDHVAGCAECRTRLDHLRHTAQAVRGLPMETPPRAFTVPPERRRSWSWAPVGWLGGAAAALLVIAFGIQQLHVPGGTGITSGTSMNYSGAGSPNKTTQQRAPGPASSTLDRFGAAAANARTVVDPRDSHRQLTVTTDRVAYSAAGSMIVTGYLDGDASADVRQVRLILRRGGYGVQLSQPAMESFSGPDPYGGVLAFQATYVFSRLRLVDPRSGSYTLVATWTAADGTTLIAELPVTIGP